MSDAPRDVRDRLGEALWRCYRTRPEDGERRWRDLPAHRHEWYRDDADRVIALAASCGLKIVLDDDGDTK